MNYDPLAQRGILSLYRDIRGTAESVKHKHKLQIEARGLAWEKQSYVCLLGSCHLKQTHIDHLYIHIYLSFTVCMCVCMLACVLSFLSESPLLWHLINALEVAFHTQSNYMEMRRRAAAGLMLKCSHTGATMGAHGDSKQTESYSPRETKLQANGD